MKNKIIYGMGIILLLINIGISLAVTQGTCVPSTQLSNVTIHSSCTTGTTLQIRINTSFSAQGTPIMNYYCYNYNTTSWVLFGYSGRDCRGGGTNQLFEESTYNNLGGVNNITISTTNTSLTTTLPDGKYYYGLTIYDQASNSQYYDPNITIDTTPPEIGFRSGTTITESYIGPAANIYVNITATDTNLNTTIINLYNSTGGLLQSLTNITNLTTITQSYNFTNLTNGVYYFNATSTDLAGLVSNTETRTATIITSFQNQSYNVTFPYANNYYSNQSILTYGFNTIDPYYNYTIYNITTLINGTIYNATITNDTSITYNLSDGKYYYDLRIYDRAGNNQYYDPNITIDTIPPSIYFSNNTPADNSTITAYSYFTNNVTVNDTNLNYTILYLYNVTGDLINTTYNTTATYNGLLDGIYYINATVYDLAGNSNITETRTLTLNYYADNITLIGSEIITNNTIPFNVYFLTQEQQETTNYTINDGAQIFANPDNAFDGNTGTSALASNTALSHTAQLGKIFNQSTYVSNIYYNVQGTSNDGGTNTLNIYLETYNSTAWNIISTLYSLSTGSTINSGIVAGTYNLNTQTYGVRVRYVGTSTSSAVTKNSYLYELQLNTTHNVDVVSYSYNVTNRTLTVNTIAIGNISYDVLFNTSYGVGGYNTCLYEDWYAVDNYVFPECIFYNHILDIRMYNSYTNISIPTITTTLNEPINNYTDTQNTTNYNITHHILQGYDYTIDLYPDTHLDRTITYTATSPAATLNLSANQSIITVNFYHAFTNELINNANITMTDVSYPGHTYTTSTGTIIFNPNTGTHNLSATSPKYTNGRYNLTVLNQDIKTINFTMYPILNLTIYDEKLSGITLTYFNFSKPTQMKYTAYCTIVEGESEITVQAIISNTTPVGPYLLNTTCDISKIRFDLLYNNIDGSTTAYHRIIVLAATIDLFSFKIFIPELSTTSILQTFLKPNDILGTYTVETNTQIRVTKLMPTGTELMLADYMDAEGKITAYLIQGDSYILTVLANDVPAKILGPYSADSAGTKILRLYDVGLIDPTIDTASKNSLTDVQFYNLTVNQSLLVMSYRDAGNFTERLNMTIYNGSCVDKRNILTQSILGYDDLNTSWGDADMSYNIFGSRFMNNTANLEYCAVWDINYWDGTTGGREQTMVYDSWIPRPGTFENEWTFPWIVMLILVVIALGLNARTVSMGSLLIMALASILYAWNWISTGTPGVTSSVVYGLALLIAIGLAFKRKVI